MFSHVQACKRKFKDHFSHVSRSSSTAPLLLLNQDLTMIVASVSFCNAFQIDPTKVVGRHLRMLGSGEWDVPQLTSLLEATATGYAAVAAYEIDLKREGQALPIAIERNIACRKLQQDPRSRVPR